MKKKNVAQKPIWEKRAEAFLREPRHFTVTFEIERAETLGYEVMAVVGPVREQEKDGKVIYFVGRDAVEKLIRLGIPHKCNPPFNRQEDSTMIKFETFTVVCGFDGVRVMSSIAPVNINPSKRYTVSKEQYEVLLMSGIPHTLIDAPDYEQTAAPNDTQEKRYDEHYGTPHQWEITNLTVRHSTKDPSGHIATLREECQVAPKHIRIRKTHIPTEEEKEAEESYERTRVV